ncbi:uncharacterized protein LOC124280682 [Haliotis rubra]|uniref:uncharacterized protein LOC124280682 n=1 Tax=Haliotis rubra TaxID=36100 RepID=UPI001EE5C735|nr:uncharacterized protein LOC124280682 [Haliotis rubra]
MAKCSHFQVTCETEQNSQALIDSQGKPWKQWPRQETKIRGIYVIKQDRLIIYVGRSKDIIHRLRSHCSGDKQAIDRHIGVTPAWRLSYNYVPDTDHSCSENCYLKYIAKLQGHWPEFNMQRGKRVPKQEKRQERLTRDKDTTCAIL